MVGCSYGLAMMEVEVFENYYDLQQNKKLVDNTLLLSRNKHRMFIAGTCSTANEPVTVKVKDASNDARACLWQGSPVNKRLNTACWQPLRRIRIPHNI